MNAPYPNQRSNRRTLGAPISKDRQLRDVRLCDVLEKCRNDQALNIKEFAVRAGISYSMAREWFRHAGFPSFNGIVFWQEFVQWRGSQNGRKNPHSAPASPHFNSARVNDAPQLSVRAAHIISESGAALHPPLIQ